MTNPQVEIMRLQLGERQFAIRRSAVRSVQHGNQVRSDRDGARLLRTTEGDLPVFRLADMLQIEAERPQAQQRVVILDDGARLWCLLVDRVSQREQVGADQIVPLPPAAIAAATALCRSAIVGEGELLLLLAAQRLHPQAAPLALEQMAEPSNGDRSAATPAATGGRGGHLVLFRLPAVDQYAIGLTPKQIDEVLRDAQPQPVPGGPAHLSGLLAWRGESVAVIDLAQRLGLTAEAAAGRRLVIVHSADGGSRLGFFAEAAVDFLELPVRHRQLQPMTPQAERFVSGAARTEGHTVLIPDLQRLLYDGRTLH